MSFEPNKDFSYTILTTADHCWLECGVQAGEGVTLTSQLTPGFANNGVTTDAFSINSNHDG